MASDIRILRIVVASPGDVRAERDRVPVVVDELNRGIAADRGLHLEVYRWETDAYPGFHAEGPQGLIDPILRIEDSDIFIGVFWKRFGTPTADGRTGTEHEIGLAREAWTKNKRPEIMVYFSQKAYSPKTKQEIDQWARVLEFRERFPTDVLWWPYSGAVDFEKLLRIHLTNWLRAEFPFSEGRVMRPSGQRASTKQISSTFFSYARDDSEFALRLGKDLKAEGASVWLDRLDIKVGQRWDRAVQDALVNCPRILVILSPSSVESDNVIDEVSFALEKKKIVIPVLYRECQIPFRLGRVQYINFTAEYERGLKELVEILTTQEAEPRQQEQAREAAEAQERAEAERKAREAEDARLKAEAERKARQEAKARDWEVRGPVPAAEDSVPQRRSVSTPAQIVVQTSSNAEVYLDDQYRGRTSPEGRLVIDTARPGKHELRVSSPGKRDFQQTIAVSAGEQLQFAATLGELGPTPGEVRENPKDGLNYVWIAPGTFMMGCSPGDTDCAADEQPSHRVTISKGFWIGQTEVTVGAYKRFAAATGRKKPSAPGFGFNKSWANDTMPIVYVSWNDARDYCTWAGGRLPTEAEWEYAARGGSTEARYGDIDEIAWYAGNSGNQTHEVAQKRANAFGLYDTLGNVWELVNDWYDENYYQHSPSEDPSGPTSGQYLVLRGGSWLNGVPSSFRASYRGRVVPEYPSVDVGFRCAREVDSP
jgi:formylglycine-generating enzyme required for sulfatase activity